LREEPKGFLLFRQD